MITSFSEANNSWIIVSTLFSSSFLYSIPFDCLSSLTHSLTQQQQEVPLKIPLGGFDSILWQSSGHMMSLVLHPNSFHHLLLVQVPDKKANSRCTWGKFLIVDLDHNSIHSCEFFKIMSIKKEFLPPSVTIQLNWNSWVVVTSFLFLFQSFLSCWTYQHCAVIWIFKEPQGFGFWNISERIFREPQGSGYLNIQRTTEIRLFKYFI